MRYMYNRTVHCLIKNGTYLNLCTAKGASPLHIACEMGYNISVKLLLNHQADINSRTEKSSVYIACQNKHGRTCHLLMNDGADIDLCTEKKLMSAPFFS